MVTVFHYTPANAKQFDGLNIDGLAGKHQKRQNFALYGISHPKHSNRTHVYMTLSINGMSFEYLTDQG